MKTAFLTGANIGQSNLLSKQLALRGWRVFSGVLPGAPHDLDGIANISVVEQDVSSDESVRSSAEFVAKQVGDRGIDLLMNIAGVANIAVGVLEGVDMRQAHRLFEINAFGQLRVVQAFLPMLRAAAPGSRLINYSSGAIIANPVGANRIE